MILSFFVAYLLFVLGNWIFKKYFSTSIVENDKALDWSSGIIALAFLVYLTMNGLAFYFIGFSYELMALYKKHYGNFFWLIDAFEFITLLSLATGMKESIRNLKSFRIITITIVSSYLLAKIISQSIGFSWMPAMSVVPGWHTTILPPASIIQAIYLFGFMVLIGLLNLIFNKMGKR